VLDAARPRPRGHWEATYAVTVDSEKEAGAALCTKVTYLYSTS
jgi:hypothetical protein